MGVIYLLKTREFVNSGQNVFKIGKSSKPGTTRTSDYPKGSILYFLITVVNEDLIDLFSIEFVQKKEYGNEYFEGDYKKIIRFMLEIIDDEEKISNSQVNHLDCKNDLLCQFCLQIFSVKTNMKKHHMRCKDKNDEVRLMEIEKGIKPVIPDNKLKCRFCNLFFSKTSNLNRHIPTCKERERYLKYLQQIPVQHQPSTIINNNTINNLNINIFNDNEDKHKMDTDCIIDILKQCLKSCPEDQITQIVDDFFSFL